MQSKFLKSTVLAAAAMPRATAALGVALCLAAGFAYTLSAGFRRVAGSRHL